MEQVKIINEDGEVVVLPIEGEVIPNSNGDQDKIIYDLDDNGDVIGWHKETLGE